MVRRAERHGNILPVGPAVNGRVWSLQAGTWRQIADPVGLPAGDDADALEKARSDAGFFLQDEVGPEYGRLRYRVYSGANVGWLVAVDVAELEVSIIVKDQVSLMMLTCQLLQSVAAAATVESAEQADALRRRHAGPRRLTRKGGAA